MSIRRDRPGLSRGRLNLNRIRNIQRLRGRGASSPPPLMRYVDEESLDQMRPGDVFVLAGSESLRNVVEPTFLAVLACPACGTSFLLTSPQFFGNTAVICQSKLCSCWFRIDNQSRLVYLPVN